MAQLVRASACIRWLVYVSANSYSYQRLNYEIVYVWYKNSKLIYEKSNSLLLFCKTSGGLLLKLNKNLPKQKITISVFY